VLSFGQSGVWTSIVKSKPPATLKLLTLSCTESRVPSKFPSPLFGAWFSVGVSIGSDSWVLFGVGEELELELLELEEDVAVEEILVFPLELEEDGLELEDEDDELEDDELELLELLEDELLEDKDELELELLEDETIGIDSIPKFKSS
jgi:hypothetical protein